MERYFKRKLPEEIENDSGQDDSSSASASTQHIVPMNSAKKESVVSDGINSSHSVEYTRLRISSHVCRSLIYQRWPFHGPDETADSSNRGNFLAFVKFFVDQSDSVAVRNTSEDSHLVAPDLHKNIAHWFVQEIVQKIKEEFKDGFFSLMFDESRDVSGNEQMVVVLRYVDSGGNVKERFIGVVNVMEASALSLKNAIDKLFADSGLNLMKIRGQTYHGLGNTEVEFSGLKTLIMKENRSVHHVHCFAHQFQLSVVEVARKHVKIANFYNMISPLVNVIGASCEHTDMIQEKKAEGIKNGLIETSNGSNQESCWGTRHESLLNLAALFSPVLDVLEVVSCDAEYTLRKVQADHLLNYFLSFDFVFSLQLMLIILEITHDLSLALERKDEGILDALALVKVTKTRLQTVRDDGWGSFFSKVSAFCNENKIDFLDMNDLYVGRRYLRGKSNVTNEFHYRLGCFNAILDAQLSEINERFNEANSELLHCVASFSPSDGFRSFDSKTLLRLARFYPDDFDEYECMMLEGQLEMYILNIRADDRFSQLKGLVDLSTLLVKTRKDQLFYMVYRLLKLALVLPIATANVERCSSAIKIVKEELENRVCDQFSNDYLVCSIEEDLLMKIRLEDVMDRLPKYENA